MEEKTHPEVITIDDDDEDYVKPLKVRKDKVKAKVSSKDVIVIPDDDEVSDDASIASAVTRKTLTVYSPEKKFKISEKKIKMLRGLVKLKYMDLTGNGKIRRLKLGVKSELEKPLIASEPNVQVNADKAESGVDHCKPLAQTEGKSEGPKTKHCQVQEEITLIKKKEQYKTGKKMLKSPPPSPSLKQSKLTEASFTPKKTCALNCKCPHQEQPAAYVVPLYCMTISPKSQQLASEKKWFSESQMTSVEGLKEENFDQSVLTTVVSFMSHCRKPPLTLVFYLFNGILLSRQSKCGKECFRVLWRIQVLHPAVVLQMVSQRITWEFISRIIKLCCEDAFYSEGNCLALNAVLALSFLVSILEEELKLKSFSVVKTNAYRLLNISKSARNIKDVITWLETALQEHASTQPTHSCQRDVCLVYLLQRMLVLSLTVSKQLEECALCIGSEMFLVYSKFPSVELKTLFLQSTQSHLLRAKLIELVVRNCCPLSQTDLEDSGIPKEGLKHIVIVDFQRSPPGLNHGSMCSSNNAIVMDSCEEFLMLLAYWLQSVVFRHRRSLQRNVSDLLRTFSMDDEDLLRGIDGYVAKLKTRLESLCEASVLSPRSYQLLDLMSSLKQFGRNLP